MFVDDVPLLKRASDGCDDAWMLRADDALCAELSARFGVAIDIASKRAGLSAIVRALNAGDIMRAQLLTVHLQIPDMPDLSKSRSPDDDCIRFVAALGASGLLAKDRDEQKHPHWSEGTPDGRGGKFAQKGSGDIASGDKRPTDNGGYMSNDTMRPTNAAGAPALPPGVDWTFVAAKEGARTNGYVPPDAQKKPDANSGVTIGHGFDLGRRSVADLRRLGLPEDLVQTLTPYLGMRGQAAQTYLDAHPLRITAAQQQLIDTPSFNEYYNRVADNYNSASHGTRFQDLPQSAQTAIVDLAYQYGTNLASATPHFWQQVTEGRWQDAHDNLMNFHDSHKTRRRAEACLLAGAIASGALSPAPDR